MNYLQEKIYGISVKGKSNTKGTESVNGQKVLSSK